MTPWRAAIVVASVLAIGAGTVTAYLALHPTAPRFKAIDVTGAPWGRDFRLTDHRGRRASLADFRGKVVMLFFGFTHCPDVCPTTLARLAQAMRKLGEGAAGVQGLFVTVDPARDTQEILSKYVPAFHPTFLGLRAEERRLAQIAAEFKVFYQAQPPDVHGSYGVDHSTQVFVFDRGGRLRLVFSHFSSAEDIATGLATLLRELAG